jgi:hypothetical protein
MDAAQLLLKSFQKISECNISGGLLVTRTPLGELMSCQNLSFRFLIYNVYSLSSKT